MSLLTPDFSGIEDGPVKNILKTIVDDYNGRITNDNIALGSVREDRLDYPPFYQEVKRTTLTAAADTITVSSVPARKYLKFLCIGIATGGTLDTNIIFNGDTGNNYCSNNDVDFAAIADVTSAANILIESGATDSGQMQNVEIEVMGNISAQEKNFWMRNISQDAAGAATVPTVVVKACKWANTSDQITSITWTNTGTGDFAVGSEIIVLGHN